ncbi:DUF1254 domain-containing protein [Desulforhabdus sp. TSK]|uniref:DUF1254 domain-containing protein n=1 Tax=Desulforhabdus sp. TSK TaxID=2925014 RepID=UPI0034D5055F
MTGGGATRADESVFGAVPLGVEAYIYGYPLVTMEYTRRGLTNVEKPEGSRAPMGQLVLMRKYPAVDDHLVTAPNADTLYATGFIDVGQEPWVLSLPDAHGRYYLFPMLDGWTTVFQVPGTRTTGTGPQTYAITGPGWKGSLPEGVKEYKSPTAMVWLLGRIYCTGTPEDYAAVHKMQDEIKLVPLSSYGKAYTPPPGKVDPSFDMKTAVRDQVNALSVDEYFTLLAKLMVDNPPAEADKPMVEKMAKIGIVPGQPFDGSKLGPAAREAFSLVPKIANEKIMLWMKEGIVAGDMKLENGWLFTTKTGVYGTNYIQRALITAIGLGANRPQDAVYPTSEGPSVLSSFSGDKKYLMHFNKGELPPVNGFWSLTMYDKDYFFVPNPINRQSISARQDLKPNADGSVDLYIQNQSPGPDKESNWLPAPKDKFILMMRLYWPKETPPSIIDDTWKVPRVKAVE